MSNKTLCIAVLFFTIFILGANQSGGLRFPADQKKCDCLHLKCLQADLRNAVYLERAFREEGLVLRKLERGTASGEYRKFAEGLKGKVKIEKECYSGPETVEFIPRGDNIHAENLGKYSNKELCEPSPNTKQDLERAESGAVCAGDAAAVRAHEDFHQQMCESIGYRAYSALHPADRAQEEAQAYQAEIAALRAEIARVLEQAKLTIQVEVKTRAQFPQNPLYSAVTIENQGEVQTMAVQASGDTIRFDAQGKHQTTNISIEGNCRITGGVPFTVPARGSIETDGQDAKVRYALEGTMPSIGMECHLPRAGGYGMSLPVPINADNVPEIKIPIYDGSEIILDAAKSEAAQTLAKSGVQLTGKMTIRLVCRQ